MKLTVFSLCIVALVISSSRSSLTSNPVSAFGSVERIIQLRDQVQKDLSYLNDFQEKRKNELSSQVILKFLDLRVANEDLRRETEPFVPASMTIDKARSITAADTKLQMLETRWDTLSTDAGVVRQSAQNTPPGDDGKVPVRFKLFWGNPAELIDGWRIGGIGTLYVASKDLVEAKAEELCAKTSLPPYAFITKEFTFAAPDKKWIEDRIPPGIWYMWTIHPAECIPIKVYNYDVPIAKTPNDDPVPINLVAPNKFPKYR
jgi:hypothetical protein